MSRETLDLSATQVSLIRECKRKYAISYVCGIKQPQTEAQALGTEVDDEQIQPYLKWGRPFDTEKKAGKIAAAGVHLLPDPKLTLQKKLFLQKFFRFPSPFHSKPGEPAPYAFLGYQDIWLPYGGMPSFPGSEDPCVADSKTTKSRQWIKTPEQLKVNEQAMLYAFNALRERRGTSKVNLDWVYFLTVATKAGNYKAESSSVTVEAEHVIEQIREIDDTGAEILELRQAAPKRAEDESDESFAARSLEYALSLEPNTAMCDQYGGCPFRSAKYCGMDPLFDEIEDDGKRRLPVMGDAFDLFAGLERKAAAQDEVLGINPPKTQPEPPPPAAVVAAPVVVPDLVVEEKPKRGRKPKAAEAAGPVTVVPEVAYEGGLEFEVVWGREARSPEAGEGYEVGPFSAKGKTNPGESLIDAMYRVHSQLGTLATMCRADRKKAFEGAK